MELPQALRSMVGAPHLFAVRSGGPILQLTNSQRVLDCRSGRPHRYTPKFSDLVGIDWQVVTIDQLRKLAAEQAAKSKAA
jgi:hypothetical protein